LGYVRTGTDVESRTGRHAAPDRRRHPRFADDARVLCFAGAGRGGFHQARLTELSADGMRIHADRSFEPGRELHAGVFLESSLEPLVVMGVVQHCGGSGEDVTVGIQFLSVTEEQRQALARLREYMTRRHGASAAVTVRAAPAILRVRDERWW
jgi:hypothetical protein